MELLHSLAPAALGRHSPQYGADLPVQLAHAATSLDHYPLCCEARLLRAVVIQPCTPMLLRALLCGPTQTTGGALVLLGLSILGLWHTTPPARSASHFWVAAMQACLCATSTRGTVLVSCAALSQRVSKPGVLARQ